MSGHRRMSLAECGSAALNRAAAHPHDAAVTSSAASLSDTPHSPQR
jgi:hypothetical protein